MHRYAVLSVVLGAGALAPAADGGILVYRFEGTLTGNFMVSGGFASAPIGSAVEFKVTVDTTPAPSFVNSNFQIWDGVAGAVTGMSATVDGFTSVVTPDAPTRMRVVNDNVSGANAIDQFWMEIDAVGAAPDFSTGIMIMSRVEPGVVSNSSLVGLDYPMSDAELDIATFTNELYIDLVGATSSERLRATITGVSVVPAPGAVLVLGGFGVVGVHRRRRG